MPGPHRGDHELAQNRAGTAATELNNAAAALGSMSTGKSDPHYQAAERHNHGQSLLDALLLIGNAELLDTEYDTVLQEGTPASVIADVARATDADEIIFGACGLGRVHALLGSVSHELLQVADRPVVVVPTGAIENVRGHSSSRASSRLKVGN
jgi:nucleotide-binding universal stress UspA family protein